MCGVTTRLLQTKVPPLAYFPRVVGYIFKLIVDMKQQAHQAIDWEEFDTECSKRCADFQNNSPACYVHSEKILLLKYKFEQGETFHWSGCETSCTSDSIHACWQCNFFLRDHCGNANRFIKHPSHPLILLPSPTYCSGAFLSNACGATGKAFSYCCAQCEVDLHVHCAFLPPKVTHKSHPHELSLIHTIPQKQASPHHNCKVCNNVLQTKQWSYCCVKCDFGLHTFCATNEVKPGLYLDDEDEELGSATAEAAAQSRPCQSSCEDQQEILLSEEAVVELFKLQFQMQMAEQLAEILASSPNPSSSA